LLLLHTRSSSISSTSSTRSRWLKSPPLGDGGKHRGRVGFAWSRIWEGSCWIYSSTPVRTSTVRRFILLVCRRNAPCPVLKNLPADGCKFLRRLDRKERSFNIQMSHV
jgi:hypothetical protein